MYKMQATRRRFVSQNTAGSRVLHDDGYCKEKRKRILSRCVCTVLINLAIT